MGMGFRSADGEGTAKAFRVDDELGETCGDGALACEC
jgi:hypothetical protein